MGLKAIKDITRDVLAGHESARWVMRMLCRRAWGYKEDGMLECTIT